jgi:quercetin dioxygenase-like cupin family protein
MTTGPEEPEAAARGWRKPHARQAGPGTSVWYMGCLVSILAGAEETENRFGLMELVAPRGLEPSRHVHFHDDEGFYVLEGRATFYVGDETFLAGPGTFVFLPYGVPHSYTFETAVIRMLAVVAPGGIEGHFQDPRFSEPAETPTLPPTFEPPDTATLAEIARDLASYGTEIVGPPGKPERASR